MRGPTVIPYKRPEPSGSRRWMGRAATATAALLWALVSLGCGKPEGAFCIEDEECLPLHCFAGTCQALGTPFGEVVFEVQPLAGQGLPAAVFTYGAQPLNLSFCSAAGVSGTFKGEGVAEVAISGRPSGLPGTTRAWVETVGSSFWIPLSPGSWTLTFHLPPDEGVVPPPVVRQVHLARCESQMLAVIEPAAIVRQARVRVVVDAERDPRPRCGVSLRLVDPSDQRPLSQALSLRQPDTGEQSSPSGPCLMPAEGWILPFVPPAGEVVELQIRSLDPGQPTVYNQDLRLPIPAEGPVDLGVVGVVGAETTLERVWIEVQDADNRPVQGVTIRLSPLLPLPAAEPSVTPVEVRWSRPAPATPVAGMPGFYETWALPGTYTARSEPRFADEELAAASCLSPRIRPGSCGESIQVEAGGLNSFRAQLPRRVLLSGEVKGLEPRQPMVDARVTALPLDGGRSFTTHTQASGRYELRLDPGMYELLVQPHEPDAAWRRLQFGAPLIVDQTKNVFLPLPARVVGSVNAGRDGKRVPLGRAFLRAFRLQEGREPMLIGEAVADSEGRFAVVLPAQE